MELSGRNPDEEYDFRDRSTWKASDERERFSCKPFACRRLPHTSGGSMGGKLNQVTPSYIRFTEDLIFRNEELA